LGMKKFLLISVCSVVMSLPSLARHIKGGEIYYQDLGPGSMANSERYFITLRLFVSCEDLSPGQLESSVNIGISYSANDAPAPGSPFTFPVTSDKNIILSSPNPCIVNPSTVCYRIRIFSATVELPSTPKGYDLVFERCCRIEGITNASPNLNIGAAYTCHMHGTDDIGLNGANSSAQFLVKDTILICQNRPFSLNFGATDINKDSLSYQFAPAYLGGDANSGSGGVVNNPVPPAQLYFINYA